MDTLDIRIIQLLQQNARTPLAQIGKQIHLSLPAVRERVRKMEQSGIIKGYYTEIDAASIGKHLRSHVLVRLKDISPQTRDDFVRYVRSEEDILHCYTITGEFEYFIFIETGDVRQLEQILSKLREHGVTQTNSSLILSELK